MAHRPGIVAFLRWTRSGTSLKGILDLARIRGSASIDVEEGTDSFTGTLHGKGVSLRFPSLFPGRQVVGRIDGHDLELGLPDRASSAGTIRFSSASFDAYRAAFARLSTAIAKARVDALKSKSPPRRVSADYVAALSAALKRPIFWAGQRRGQTVELTRTSRGEEIYIRYLPPNVPVGNPEAKYLLVGTYRVAAPVQSLRKLASRHGSAIVPLTGGGVAAIRGPTNVYVGYPETDVEVEIFSPTTGAARRLVTSGAITRVW